MSTAFAHRPGRGLTDEWLTPPELLAKLGTFDLDPCTPKVRPWSTATQHYSVADDGLSKPWTGRVWLNPPYSQMTRWMEPMAQHGNGIALIFARTETRWFFSTVWEQADGVLFLKNRLHFHNVEGIRAKGNAGGPHVLVAYGMSNARVLHDNRKLGRYLPVFH